MDPAHAVLRLYKGRSIRDGEPTEEVTIDEIGHIHQSAAFPRRLLHGELRTGVVAYRTGIPRDGFGVCSWDTHDFTPFPIPGIAIATLGPDHVLFVTDHEAVVWNQQTGDTRTCTLPFPGDSESFFGNYHWSGEKFATGGLRVPGILIADTSGPRWIEPDDTPGSAARAIWLGDDHLLLGRGRVIDTTGQTVAMLDVPQHMLPCADATGLLTTEEAAELSAKSALDPR